MKSGGQNFTMGTTQWILTSFALFVCLCSCAAVSVAQQKPSEKLDRQPFGKPVRENLPNGGYREVTKNKKGQRIQEEEYDGLGVRTRRKEIKAVHPNGREAEVENIYYGVRGGKAGEIVKREEINYDNKGRPTEKTTLTDYNEMTGWQTKTVTTWPPGSGPDGETKTYKRGGQEWMPISIVSPPPDQEATASDPQYSPVEFYAGFSHNRVDVGGDGDEELDGGQREGFHGFNASITGNVSRYVGLKFDYSFHRRVDEVGFDGFVGDFNERHPPVPRRRAA